MLNESDSEEINQLILDLSSNQSNQKRRRSQVQELPHQQFTYNNDLELRYKKLLQEYQKLKNQFTQFKQKKQQVIAKAQTEDDDVFYSFDRSEQQRQNRIFSPYQSPLKLSRTFQQRQSQYIKHSRTQSSNSLLPITWELFSQLYFIRNLQQIIYFKDLLLTPKGVLFRDDCLEVKIIDFQKANYNSAEITLTYKNIKKNSSFFLDLMDYSDSSNTLKHQLYPQQWQRMVYGFEYKQVVKLEVKKIPFTFLEVNGEYDNENHIKMVIPNSLLNYCRIEQIEDKCQQKKHKIIIQNANQAYINRFIQAYGEQFKFVFFENQQINFVIKKNKQDKYKLICQTNDYWKTAQQLLSTLSFIFETNLE